jgi:hypothetical protein
MNLQPRGLVGLAVWLLLLWPASAWAYIDPGSGVVLLQIIIAACIGVIFKLRRAITGAWRSLVSRLRR